MDENLEVRTKIKLYQSNEIYVIVGTKEKPYNNKAASPYNTERKIEGINDYTIVLYTEEETSKIIPFREISYKEVEKVIE